MKTRDEAIRDLATQAMDQCSALCDKMYAIIDGTDDDGEPEDDRLCGIERDSAGRLQLVFQPYGAGRRGPRYVVYVDAILALAKLLGTEPEVRTDE